MHTPSHYPLYVSPDGSYGSADNLILADTRDWKDDAWKKLLEEADNDVYDFIVKETTTLRIAPPTNFGELMKLVEVYFPGAYVEEDNIGQLVIYTDLKLAHTSGDVADAPLIRYEDY